MLCSMEVKMRKFTSKQIDKIVDIYLSNPEASCTSIAKIYATHHKKISSLLRERNILLRNPLKKRKYELDESFFEQINSEEKAYFLGLLYADGYVGDKCRIVGITLQERDKNILEKLRKIIGYSKPLVYRKSPNPNWQNTYVLDMYGQKTYQNVVRLGCTSKKSLTLKFPTEDQVPNHLLRHFVRGYFCGDGSISNHSASANITSSITFLLPLKKMLENMGIESKMNNLPCNDITKQLRFNKVVSVIKFLDWIYEGACLYIDRKYAAYLFLKEKYKEFIKS